MSSGSINRPVLPENPKVKDINKYKKQLNWGDLPAFYHMIATSVSELENLGSMGFDNALKRILNKSNWNIELLGGYIDSDNVIHCDNKPRLALYQVFTDRGFEIHCFPFAKDREIDQVVKGHRLMEFDTWDPGTMRLLVRLNLMHKFIDYYFEQGDVGDRALIDHAINLVDRLIKYMQNQVNIVKVDGVTLRQYFERREKSLDAAELDSLLVGSLQGNALANNESK